MKKILVFFLILLNSLFAENNLTLEKFMFYKTIDSTLTLETIKKKSSFFKPLSQSSEMKDKKFTYWIKIKLNKNIESGRYMVSYGGFDFDLYSLKKSQTINRHAYQRDRLLTYSFNYDKQADNLVYYFKVLNSVTDNREPTFLIENYDVYYEYALLKPNSKFFYISFGIIVGLMLMVSIYNIAIYFYIREASFLYYAFMQFFLIYAIIYDFEIIHLTLFFYYITALLSGLFGTLFIRSFFDTLTYLPKIDKVLKVYILLIAFDFIYLVIYEYSILSRFGLFSIFGILALLVGFLRMREGFSPAKFFLMGWIILILSIFITEHGRDIYGISPFLFGPPFEALFIAIALALKLKLLLDEKKQQENLLVHQSKLASVGEMIGNIAHQWKQPLTYLSYNFMNLRERSKCNLLDDEYLNKKLDKADAQLDFMSQTVDNFKDFYLPNKRKEKFSVEKASLETLEIVSYEFEQKNIEVIFEVKEDIELKSYKNEYKQVFLNLLTNAKDVFMQRKVFSPKIIITIDKNYIAVLDNAGGIPKEILHRIYEPYFTTKIGNSGIGLYMSKMILERDMNSTLTVENHLEGTLFKIYFSKN